uniref:Neuropeptide-Like Protein n=1 Tax=Macrostomum lignano TaxID=282301 RepID=A0A1I8F6P0_9PLAT
MPSIRHTLILLMMLVGSHLVVNSHGSDLRLLAIPEVFNDVESLESYLRQMSHLLSTISRPRFKRGRHRSHNDGRK